MKNCIILYYCIYTAFIYKSVNNACLHKGCTLTEGLQEQALNETIRQNLYENEKEIDILRVMTWNILHDELKTGDDTWNKRKNDVCYYIQKISPTILGLQEAEPHQLYDLQRCLKGYSYIKGETVASDIDTHYNPILIRNDDRLNVVRSGTFWLSETPNVQGSTTVGTDRPRIATWAELTLEIETDYQQSLNRKATVYDHILNLLQSFTNTSKENSQVEVSSSENVQNNKKLERIFVANTHLDWKDVEVARRQIKHLQHHLKHNIMDRRRYKVILMGDLNWEDNTVVYKAMSELKWLTEVHSIARKAFPALTAVHLETLEEKEMNDYIFHNKFQTIISATLMDLRPYGRLMSDHRPVFAALLP